MQVKGGDGQESSRCTANASCLIRFKVTEQSSRDPIGIAMRPLGPRTQACTRILIGEYLGSRTGCLLIRPLAAFLSRLRRPCELERIRRILSSPASFPDDESQQQDCKACRPLPKGAGARFCPRQHCVSKRSSAFH